LNPSYLLTSATFHRTIQSLALRKQSGEESNASPRRAGQERVAQGLEVDTARDVLGGRIEIAERRDGVPDGVDDLGLYDQRVN
jgi:hypothetical protein